MLTGIIYYKGRKDSVNQCLLEFLKDDCVFIVVFSSVKKIPSGVLLVLIYHTNLLLVTNCVPMYFSHCPTVIGLLLPSSSS